MLKTVNPYSLCGLTSLYGGEGQPAQLVSLFAGCQCFPTKPHSQPCNNVVCRIKARTSVIYKHHEMKEYKLIVNFNEVSKQVNLVKIILSWLKSHSFKVIENEAIISESYVLQIFNCSQMSRFCGRQPDIRRLLTRNTSQLIKHCLKKKTLLFNFNLSANSNHISSYSTLYVHLQHKKNHLLSR
jgi:hypothetical protein